MKVVIYNEDGNMHEVVDNVDTVKSCKDGRHLVLHTITCPCCKHETKMTLQVPAQMKVEINA
jgi:hypothetical protein